MNSFDASAPYNNRPGLTNQDAAIAARLRRMQMDGTYDEWSRLHYPVVTLEDRRRGWRKQAIGSAILAILTVPLVLPPVIFGLLAFSLVYKSSLRTDALLQRHYRRMRWIRSIALIEPCIVLAGGGLVAYAARDSSTFYWLLCAAALGILSLSQAIKARSTRTPNEPAAVQQRRTLTGIISADGRWRWDGQAWQPTRAQ